MVEIGNKGCNQHIHICNGVSRSVTQDKDNPTILDYRTRMDHIHGPGNCVFMMDKHILSSYSIIRSAVHRTQGNKSHPPILNRAQANFV